jgi:hypothetical protein
MKKLIFILLVCFSISFAQSQIANLYIEAGPNYSYMYKNDYTLLKTNYAFFDEDSFETVTYNAHYHHNSQGKFRGFISLIIDFPISKNLSFSTGFRLNNYKQSLKTTITSYLYGTNTTNEEFKYLYIDLPLMINVKLIEQKLILSTGISISSLVSSKCKTGNESSYNLTDYEDIGLNLNGSISYFITKRIGLGILYSVNCNNLEKGISTQYYTYNNHSYNVLRLHTFSLKLTYKLL